MIVPAILLSAAQAAPAAPPPAVRIVNPPHSPLPAQSLFSRDDYPAAAKGTGAHGVVSVVLQIDTQGRVTRCSTLKSSGWPVLDTATCQIMQRRAHFNPATDEKGNPVVSLVAQQMEWKAP